jgi:hypothetical protein
MNKRELAEIARQRELAWGPGEAERVKRGAVLSTEVERPGWRVAHGVGGEGLRGVLADALDVAAAA